MTFRTPLPTLALLAAIASFSPDGIAKALVITPEHDISVVGNARSGNTSFYAGLYAGNVFGDSVARMYEKFSLPAYVAGDAITSALFEISYSPRQSYYSGQPLQIWAVSNDWDNGTLTRGVTPVIDYANLLGKIKPGVNSTIQIDLTDFANQQYQKNAGAVSFVIMSKNEGGLWNDYLYFNESKALNVTLTSAVPEPSTAAMLLLGMLMLVPGRAMFVRWRKVGSARGRV